MTTLKVGDTVLWSGSFGMDAAERATVVSIEQTKYPREKDGWDVDEISWDIVRENKAVVTLSNDHWAYGEQIRPI